MKIRFEFHATPSMLMIGLGYIAGYCIAIQFPCFAILIKWGE